MRAHGARKTTFKPISRVYTTNLGAHLIHVGGPTPYSPALCLWVEKISGRVAGRRLDLT